MRTISIKKKERAKEKREEVVFNSPALTENAEEALTFFIMGKGGCPTRATSLISI